MAFAHLRADRYGEASRWAENSLRRQPNGPDALRALAISSALAGDLKKAQRVMQRLMQIAPGARISTSVPLFVSPERRALFTSALHNAGMPE